MADSLSDSSKHFLNDYFAWSKQQRDKFLKDIDFEFKAFKEGTLFQQHTFNRNEVDELLNGHYLVLQSAINREAQRQSTASGEMLRTICAEADKRGMPIQVSVRAMEDPNALSALEQMEQKALSKTKLQPLAASSASEQERQKQLAEANEEIGRLNDKLRKMTEQFSTMMKEKTALQAQVLHLQDARSTAVAPAAPAAPGATHLDQSGTVARLQQELSAVRNDMQLKLNQSSQFQTLKKMLAQKNQQVKQLRAALVQYDPAAAGADDDGLVEEED
jgi:leucine zipper transcription factor-like protein 1